MRVAQRKVASYALRVGLQIGRPDSLFGVAEALTWGIRRAVPNRLHRVFGSEQLLRVPRDRRRVLLAQSEKLQLKVTHRKSKFCCQGLNHILVVPFVELLNR